MIELAEAVRDTSWAMTELQQMLQAAATELGLSPVEAAAAGHRGKVAVRGCEITLSVSYDGSSLVLTTPAGSNLLATPQDRQQALACSLLTGVTTGACVGLDLAGPVVTQRVPIATCDADVLAALMADLAVLASTLQTLGLSPLCAAVDCFQRTAAA